MHASLIEQIEIHSSFKTEKHALEKVCKELIDQVERKKKTTMAREDELREKRITLWKLRKELTRKH